MTRRSSSYHGPRCRDYDGRETELQHRGGSGSQTIDKARDKAHRYGVKDEVKDVFTSSKEGLAGGAVGALVGGWAAQKAQSAYGKEKNGAGNAVLTLLGAAVGGLAVNAVIDKWEDGKRDTKDKQEKWEDKFGSDGENGRGSDGGRSRGTRRDSKYADGYGSDSDGGRSHRSQRSRRSKRDDYD